MLVIDGKYNNDDGLSTTTMISSAVIFRKTDNATRQTKDKFRLIKCSKARESFLIVGSHSKFSKERGSSDQNIDKKSAEQEDRSQTSDLSAGSDHRWIEENLHDP
jgi:hypothetical protein